MEVQDFAVVAEGLESVGAPLRYQQRRPIVRAEPLSMPPQECRRAAAQIDGDIEDLAAQTGDELDLRVGCMLEMHAPHRAALPRQRPIDLEDGLGNQRAQ